MFLRDIPSNVEATRRGTKRNLTSGIEALQNKYAVSSSHSSGSGKPILEGGCSGMGVEGVGMGGAGGPVRGSSSGHPRAPPPPIHPSSSSSLSEQNVGGSGMVKRGYTSSGLSRISPNKNYFPGKQRDGSTRGATAMHTAGFSPCTKGKEFLPSSTSQYPTSLSGGQPSSTSTATAAALPTSLSSPALMNSSTATSSLLYTTSATVAGGPSGVERRSMTTNNEYFSSASSTVNSSQLVPGHTRTRVMRRLITPSTAGAAGGAPPSSSLHLPSTGPERAGSPVPLPASAGGGGGHGVGGRPSSVLLFSSTGEEGRDGGMGGGRGRESGGEGPTFPSAPYKSGFPPPPAATTQHSLSHNTSQYEHRINAGMGGGGGGGTGPSSSSSGTSFSISNTRTMSNPTITTTITTTNAFTSGDGGNNGLVGKGKSMMMMQNNNANTTSNHMSNSGAGSERLLSDEGHYLYPHNNKNVMWTSTAGRNHLNEAAVLHKVHTTEGRGGSTSSASTMTTTTGMTGNHRSHMVSRMNSSSSRRVNGEEARRFFVSSSSSSSSQIPSSRVNRVAHQGVSASTTTTTATASSSIILSSSRSSSILSSSFSSVESMTEEAAERRGGGGEGGDPPSSSSPRLTHPTGTTAAAAMLTGAATAVASAPGTGMVAAAAAPGGGGSSRAGVEGKHPDPLEGELGGGGYVLGTKVVSLDRYLRTIPYCPKLIEDIARSFLEKERDAVKNFRDRTLSYQSRRSLTAIELSDLHHYYASPDYLAYHPDITPRMRVIVIDWLVGVHKMFRHFRETLFLCVNIFDRYLSVLHTKSKNFCSITRSKLQLVAVSAYLIAVKYEELLAVELKTLVSIVANVYTKEEIISTEMSMCQALNFQFTVPTSYQFSMRLLIVLEGSTLICEAAKPRRCMEQLFHLTNFFLEHALLDYDALQFTPSQVGNAAVYLAVHTLQYNILLHQERQSSPDEERLSSFSTALSTTPGLSCTTTMSSSASSSSPRYPPASMSTDRSSQMRGSRGSGLSNGEEMARKSSSNISHSSGWEREYHPHKNSGNPMLHHQRHSSRSRSSTGGSSSSTNNFPPPSHYPNNNNNGGAGVGGEGGGGGGHSPIVSKSESPQTDSHRGRGGAAGTEGGVGGQEDIMGRMATVWTPALRDASEAVVGDFFWCAQGILNYVKSIRRSKYQTVRDKYASSRFGEVSKLELPPGLPPQDRVE